MNRIETIIASDTDYDELIAEIYVDGQYVAQITQELGPEKMRLELPKAPRKSRLFSRRRIDRDTFAEDVDLAVFLEAVEIATKRLHGEMA